MPACAVLVPCHAHGVFEAAAGPMPGGHTEAQRTRRVREELERSHTMTEAMHGARLDLPGRFKKAADATACSPLAWTPRA